MAQSDVYNIRDFFAFEAITVSTTSIGFTAATYRGTGPGAHAASFALVTIEGDQIRWRADGTDADSTSHLANVGDVLELQGLNAVRNFRAIRVATNATLRVSYGR